MLKKSNQKGFTIIEVLIVLAIAGLILLVVFLAVPALQRNSRNNTKRSDVSKALGAVGEFTANNNGKIPATADLTTLTNSANLSNGTTLYASIPTTVATAKAMGTGEIEIVTGVVCNQSATMVTAATLTDANFQGILTAGSTRSVVAIYSVESNGGQNTTQCQGS